MRFPVLLFVGAFFAACGMSELDVDEDVAYVDHDPGVITSGLTAGEAGGCSTAIVGGLDRQLIEELNCISPNLMQSFAGPHTRYGATVVPYLHPTANAALKRATTAANDFMTINSAYRTVAQQFVLYRWWQQGRCGIQVAAAPGASNHQSGRALDVQSYTFWRPYLQNQGWQWHGASDVVHYDYFAAPALGGRSVLAFQRLWNKNRSNKLAEDGVWGPASNAAMSSSPVEGFTNHGCAAPPAPETGTLKGIVHQGMSMTAVIAGAKVEVGGKTLTTDAAGLYTVTLPTGMHAIKVTATGYEDGALTRQVAGGQTVWGSVGLTPKGMPDAVAPDLDVATPVDGARTDVALIALTGTTSDMSGAVTLTLAQNGEAPVGVTVMGTLFEQQVKLRPGLNELVLTARDVAGNVATVRTTARFRAGLEGEVTTPDLRADGIANVQLSLRDLNTGAVLMSGISAADGTYAFEVDTVPYPAKLVAEAPGYVTFERDLIIGADAREVYSFALSRGEGTTQEPQPAPNEEDMHIKGGCSVAGGFPIGLLALALLRAGRPSRLVWGTRRRR
ncbi:MAG: D-alanyl-D-alanine carboxypeptidase family protein [Myxococcaceae bacterium]|nr:D-alanyl-D-alanine carboxypeptidase family protein [Myxococcaceae bacterium]